MTTTEPVWRITLDEVSTPATTAPDRRRWLDRSAFEPIDGASLGFVRIGFGLMTAWEGVRYLDRGWVDRYYGGEPFTFTYWPLDFVQPLPGALLALPWLLMIVAGLWLASGVLHRGGATLAWLTLSYTLLADKAQYLNHIYLMALIAFLLMIVPAGNDLALGRRRARSVPAIAVDLLAFQVSVPYLFGGIAKLNGDWLRGDPLIGWLAEADDLPLLGPLFAQAPVGHTLAIASLVFDLTIVGFLLWPRTRPLAFLYLVVFHVLNARLFSIGVFPWTMILVSTIFLPPDWPRTVVSSLRDPDDRRLLPTAAAATLGAAIGAWFFPTVVLTHVIVSAFGFGLATWMIVSRRVGEPSGADRSDKTHDELRWKKLWLVLAAVWVAVQMTVPLRHHLYPTDVNWAEDGHRFSWRMKVREKHGTIALTIREADGRLVPVDLEAHLRPRQISKMTTRPDMVIQFAQELESMADRDIQVYAESFVSLNGRDLERYIRPDVDLTTVDIPDFGPAWYMTDRPD